MKDFNIRKLNNEELKAFKKLQKQAILNGLKSKLPVRMKDYIKEYTGSKIFARSDYYFEWFNEIKNFYKKQAKKVNILIEKHDLEITKRDEIKKIEGRSLKGMLALYTDYLKTFKNVLNKNYLSTINKETKELDKQIKNKIAGKKPKIYFIPKAVLSTFGGSKIALAYNNYMQALAVSGLIDTANVFARIPIDIFDKILRSHKDDFELVYKYRSAEISDDEAYFIAIVDILESEYPNIWDKIKYDVIMPKNYKGNKDKYISEYLDTLRNLSDEEYYM